MKCEMESSATFLFLVKLCSFHVQCSGITPKIRMLSLFPDEQRSVEPFMCLALALER